MSVTAEHQHVGLVRHWVRDLDSHVPVTSCWPLELSQVFIFKECLFRGVITRPNTAFLVAQISTAHSPRILVIHHVEHLVLLAIELLLSL